MTKDKKLVNTLIAIILFVAIKLIVPPVNGLTAAGINVIGVFVATIYLWMTVGVDWVSLLSIGAFAACGATTANAVYQASFGNWLTPFLIVGMILNYALGEHGVTVRIVKWFMTRKWLEGRPWLFVTVYLFAFYFVSLFLDCGPAACLFLPMATELCESLGYSKDDKFPKMIFEGILTCILLGFCATPISHIIPVLFVGFVTRDVTPMTFTKWISIGIPFSLVVFVVMILFFRFIVRPDVSKLKNYKVSDVEKTVVPLSKAGKITLYTYIVIIVLWLFPDLGKAILPGFAAWLYKVGAVIPAIAGTVALCLIKVDDKPVINFPVALNKVNWIQIILVCAMNAMGTCITAADAGITSFLSTTLGPVLQNTASIWLIVAVVAIWVIVQTNFASCLVTGQMVYAIIVPLLVAISGMEAAAAAIAVMIGIVCNIGILTPPASGPAAIFITTDWFTMKDSVKYGSVVVISILAAIFVCYPLGLAIL